MFLDILERKIHDGRLTVTMPDGSVHRFGTEGPQAEWIFRAPRTTGRILRDPGLAVGETYMDGAWEAGDGGLTTLLELLMRNFPPTAEGWLTRLATTPLTLLQTWNRRGASRRNVARHYNLDEWLFRRFLDTDMQYSCAYFEREEMSLEEAQQAKCRHIAGKLLLRPGQCVLDIGCGWGGLALFLARHADVEVTGITLSEEQLRVARQRAKEAGLEGRVHFELVDYRDHRPADGRPYDRIVSVGMFEHVGPAQYTRFFTEVSRRLTDDGVALIHTIGHFGRGASVNPWLRHYIFPGGAIPSLTQVADATARTGLITTDLEVLRLHYAYTLARWLDRFHANGEEIRERMGDRFYRLWEFYLASCEAAFRWRGLAVFQIQIAKSMDAAPITRRYLYAEEPSA